MVKNTGKSMGLHRSVQSAFRVQCRVYEWQWDYGEVWVKCEWRILTGSATSWQKTGEGAGARSKGNEPIEAPLKLELPKYAFWLYTIELFKSHSDYLVRYRVQAAYKQDLVVRGVKCVLYKALSKYCTSIPCILGKITFAWKKKKRRKFVFF